MKHYEQLLATLILANPDKPVRVIDTMAGFGGVKLREISSVAETEGVLLDDYYYVRSDDFQPFKSYCYGMTEVGQPVPTDEEIKKLYDDLPWEEIICVYI